jgi:hypothetical protein
MFIVMPPGEAALLPHPHPLLATAVVGKRGGKRIILKLCGVT